MKFGSILRIILATGCLQTIAAQVNNDTLWLCRNQTPEVLWLEMGLTDTFPDNRGAFEMVDTGDSYNGSAYVNFDYQFGDPHPGYAGFKFFWDNGIMQFYTADHDSMVLWHKGPLPGHKVKMIWAQGSAGCGTPINYQDYYEFKSSDEWKREAFGFPDGFIRDGLFELRMLIYNDTETSDTSPPGYLKIDNMFFKKSASPIGHVNPARKSVTSPKHFIPTVSGKVTLTIFSLQGEQLFREQVDVTGGRTYLISQFARRYSNLPAKWIQFVQICGCGVSITKKVYR